MSVTVRHRIRAPQLESRIPLVAIAAARGVLEEAAQYLVTPLPDRYAADLAHCARQAYAHSPHFRRRLHQSADAGRDELWCFLRHWLAGPPSDRAPRPLRPPATQLRYWCRATVENDDLQ